MTRSELIDYCLAKPQAKGDFPFDDRTLTVRVGKKILLLVDLEAEEESANLKCEPELSADLRAAYPAIKPGYHMNKEHWNTILLDGSLPDELVRSLADGSYELVEASLTAAARAEAGLPPRPRRRS